MAVKKLRAIESVSIESPTRLKAVDGLIVADSASSPARELQQLLANRTLGGHAFDDADRVERWSQRTRLLVLLGSAGLFWGVIVSGASLVSTAIG